MSEDRARAANRPWKTAVLAGMASYLDAGALVTAGVAIGVLYAPEMGLDAGAIGLLLGLQTLAFAVGALFGGRLGDRFGRRRVFTVSLVLYALGVAVLTAATGPVMLYVGIVAVGLAIGADLPVSLSLINEEAPEGKKGRMIVFSQLLWVAGIVAVLALNTAVAQLGVLGGRILFGQLLVVAVLVLLLRLTLRESVEWSESRRRTDADEAAGGEAVHFSRLGQLFRPPVLAAVLATALYYTTWNIGANTFGQFGSFLWVNLTGGDVAVFSALSLVGLPIGLAAGLLFMRVVDRPSRHAWFVVGTVLIVLAWTLPVVLGPTQFALVATNFLFGIGSGFAGETIYKVWSQELVPTLLRSTAQGVTMAFARVVAALAGFGTPALALASPPLLFGLVLALAVVATLIGLLWVPTLPEAGEIEPPPVTIIDEGPAREPRRRAGGRRR
jgi:MFS transporter, SP family, inositol transporter